MYKKLHEEVYKKWDKSYKAALVDVGMHLYIKRDYTEDVEFQKLALWIFETEENPWGFMPMGWEGAKDSAEGFASFLHCLNHAFIDDGDLCFVDDPVHGPCMEFTFYGDEKDGDGVYLSHHRKDHEKQTQRMKEMLERCGKPNPTYSSIEGIEYHTDIDRFILGFEKHRIKSEALHKKNNERLATYGA